MQPPDWLAGTEEWLAVGYGRRLVRGDLRLNVPFPLIVLVAAIIGYVGGRFAPSKFVIGGGHGAAKNSYGPALIDDDTPTPEHTRFSWGHLVRLLMVGAGLWALPMGLLTLSFGWDGTLTQMGWFFTKAALMTFGGAYAVLPYVYQGAVGTTDG